MNKHVLLIHYHGWLILKLCKTPTTIPRSSIKYCFIIINSSSNSTRTIDNQSSILLLIWVQRYPVLAIHLPIMNVSDHLHEWQSNWRRCYTFCPSQDLALILISQLIPTWIRSYERWPSLIQALIYAIGYGWRYRSPNHFWVREIAKDYAMIINEYSLARFRFGQLAVRTCRWIR